MFQCVTWNRFSVNVVTLAPQFPRVRDTSFTGVTVEECKLLLSGMESHSVIFNYMIISENTLWLLVIFFLFFTAMVQGACNRWMKKKRVCGRQLWKDSPNHQKTLQKKLQKNNPLVACTEINFIVGTFMDG